MKRDDPALANAGAALRWHPVCALDDITPDTGVGAWLEGRAIAVFRLAATGEVFAIDNIDPHTGASVLSRGLVGNLGERLVVASPLHKQHFCLKTGQCLESPAHAVRTYPARIDAGMVCVAY